MATGLVIVGCASPRGPTQAAAAAGERVEGEVDPAFNAAGVRQERTGIPSEWPAPVEDNALFGFALLDQFEYRTYDGAPDTVRWDALGWYGTDYDRLWFRSEGESTTSGPSSTDAEFQLLYGRLIAPFWDAQVGVRYDTSSGPGPDRSRWLGVLSLQGFAPYRFEVEPALFVSEDGDLSARFTGTADWLLTQRLILQPRLETEVAAQDVEEFGVGQGLEYLELGLRLRYELRREFAPYAGVEWGQLFGRTADLARAGGDDDSNLTLVFGLRLWR